MEFYNKDSYSLADIEYLINNEVEENIHLDYKAAAALAKEDKKRIEITKDVSAFANSDGGIIVYGIAEYDHRPKEISPIDGRTYTKEWLENVIHLIQPRIEGLKIYPIRVGDLEKSIYIVQIPKSDSAPHMANNHCYYGRKNFQSLPLEDYEVKELYNRVSIPKLLIDNCAFYVEEENRDHITYHLAAAIINHGKRACESYKLNFYINNAQYCDISYKTLEEKNAYTFLDHNRIKLSSCSQAPIYPTEQLDMGHFRITVKKAHNELFFQNLVIELMLFYTGGKENLAFIPLTGKFIEEREKITQILVERML